MEEPQFRQYRPGLTLARQEQFLLNPYFVNQTVFQICENVLELDPTTDERQAMCDLQSILSEVCPFTNDVPPLNKGYRAWPFRLFPEAKSIFNRL